MASVPHFLVPQNLLSAGLAAHGKLRTVVPCARCTDWHRPPAGHCAPWYSRPSKSALPQCGRPQPNSANKRNPDRFRAMASVILSRNRGKHKTKDKPCRQGSLDATPAESVISKTTCLTTYRPSNRETCSKEKTAQTKESALRPPPITSASFLAPIFSTPRARTVRSTSGRKLAVAGNLFGFYPRK